MTVLNEAPADLIDLPATMRAAQLSAAEKLDVVEVQVPSLGPADVLIEVAAAGICGSDLHAWHGRHPFRRPPVILGHELSGTIVRVGSSVSPSRIGEQVVVEPQRICGVCTQCRAGRNQLCENRVLPGMNEWMGCIADYFAAPADRTFVVPAGLDLELAVLAEPLAVAVHAAKRARLACGMTVNIIGAGTIGAMVSAVARSLGAEVCVVTDVDPEKLAFAATGGASTPVDVRDASFWDAEDFSLRYAADVTFVAATAPSSVVEAGTLTKTGGTIVLLGLYADTAIFRAARLVTAEQQLVASSTYDSSDFHTALELLAADTSLFRPIITRRIALEELEEEFRAQAAQERFTMKTLIIPSKGLPEPSL